MDWQTLTLIGMLLALIAYIQTLYHLAHGNERKAVEMGSKIVLEALCRDGRIAKSVSPEVTEDKPVNIDEDEQGAPEEEGELSPIIMSRSKRHAEQIGEKLNRELMEAMDEKV
jgi:hypothetical protein